MFKLAAATLGKTTMHLFGNSFRQYSKKVANLPLYGLKEIAQPIPKTKIPENPMDAELAYTSIKNELQLNTRPGLNLATFVNANSDRYGARIVEECAANNYIDGTEYPFLTSAGKRSIWMLAHELGTKFDRADKDPDTATGFYGTPTIGSSEAIMLGLIAHKFKWAKNNKTLLRKGKSDAQDKPIVLVSAHAHGCFDKYCRYFDAVPLYISLDKAPYTINGKQVFDILNTKIEDPISPYAKIIRKEIGYLKKQSHRTIGELVMCVASIVGTTFTGNIDDTLDIDKAVESYCKQAPKELALNIPIHVDAASAGFVLLFSKNGLEKPFSFQYTKRVRSINISNHKFGMTYPGMGSIIFRNSSIVDPSLIYHISYLGGNFSDYTVNFSRSASPIVMQYYNFLRFGRAGYAAIINNCLKNTQSFLKNLQRNIVLKTIFKNISDSDYLPIIVLTWVDDNKPKHWDMIDISNSLKENGWFVAAYVIPKKSPEENSPADKGTQVLRIVVQQSISRDKLDNLLNDLESAVKRLEERYSEKPSKSMHKGYHC